MTEAKIDNAIERRINENIARTTDLNELKQIKADVEQLKNIVKQLQNRLLMVAGSGN